MLRRVVFPVLGGALIAATIATLWSLKPPWVAFVLVGVAACVPAFLVRQGSWYWLALFLFVLPFNLGKFFGTKEYVLHLLETAGAMWGVTSPILQASDLPLMALVATWVLGQTAPRPRLFLPRISSLPLGYLLWVGLGSLFAVHPAWSVFEVLRQAKFYLIYLFTSSAVSPRKQGTLILVMLLVGLAVQSGVTIVRYESQQVSALFGTIFGEWGESLADTEDARLEAVTRDAAGGESAVRRGIGTLPHPNGTAMHLELTLPMALSLFLIGPWRGSKWLYLGLCVLGTAALYVTFSRGGMIGLAVSVIVCVATTVGRGVIGRRALWAVLGAAALVAPVVAFKAPSYLTAREDYTRAHLGHLEVGTRMIQMSPLMGVGLNNSTPLRAQFTPGGESQIERALPLHSHYLLQAVETGLVGFALYYSFFGLVAIEAFRRSSSRDLPTAALGLGVLGAYAAIATNTITDYVGADGLQTYLWFYAGLIVALMREEREERPDLGRPHRGPRRLPAVTGEARA